MVQGYPWSWRKAMEGVEGVLRILDYPGSGSTGKMVPLSGMQKVRVTELKYRNGWRKMSNGHIKNYILRDTRMKSLDNSI